MDRVKLHLAVCFIICRLAGDFAFTRIGYADVTLEDIVLEQTNRDEVVSMDASLNELAYGLGVCLHVVGHSGIAERASGVYEFDFGSGLHDSVMVKVQSNHDM